MWPWSSKEESSAPRLRDEELGELTFDDGTWNGKLRHGDHELSILISGDSNEPDAIARKLVVDALPRLDELFGSAVAYQLKDLSAQELAMGPYVFRPTGICSGADWQLDQLSITLTMELEGDEHAIWRVEIGPNGPLDAGRDS